MKLIVQNNSGNEIISKELNPRTTPYKIGRDPTCDIVLDSLQVSKVHALLTIFENGFATIQDNQSINGIYINEQRIGLKPVRFKSNAKIIIADYVLFSPDVKDIASIDLKKILIVLLLACLSLLIAVVLKVKYETKTQDLHITEQTNVILDGANAIPNLQLQDATKAKDAAALIREGEMILYASNDYVQAAVCFRMALEKDPNNVIASNYFFSIRNNYLQKILDKAVFNLQMNDLKEAKQNLELMSKIDPQDSRTIQLARIINGIQQYAAAQQLVAEKKWQEAFNILSNIEIPDDSNRIQLLDHVSRQIDAIKACNECIDMLNATNYVAVLKKAQDVLLMGSDIDGDILKNANDYYLLAERLIKFKELNNSNTSDVNIIKLSYVILANPLIQKTSAVKVDINSVLSQIAKKYESKADDLISSMQNDLSLANRYEKENKTFKAMQCYRNAVDITLILQLLNRDVSAIMDVQSVYQKLSDYQNDLFQKGYVLKQQYSYSEAMRCFEEVMALADVNSDFYRRALIELNSIKQNIQQ